MIYKKALSAAADMLSRRMLTEKQLREKLEKKEFSQEVIDYTIARLSYLELIDDRKYAESAVRSLKNRGYGVMRIRQELKMRGIESDICADVLEDFEPDIEVLTKLLDKRLKGDISDRKEVQKATAALARKGFTWEQINRALKVYGSELENYEFD